MRTTFDEMVANAKTFLDVLLILKQKTMLDTHVATLVYLDSIVSPFDGKKGIWSCRPFPLNEKQPEYKIQAYYFSADGDGFKKGSIALIVFCDMNFISGLMSPSPEPKETKDQVLHSLKYGVIVSLPGVALTESEKDEILEGI